MKIYVSTSKHCPCPLTDASTRAPWSSTFSTFPGLLCSPTPLPPFLPGSDSKRPRLPGKGTSTGSNTGYMAQFSDQQRLLVGFAFFPSERRIRGPYHPSVGKRKVKSKDNFKGKDKGPYKGPDKGKPWARGLPLLRSELHLLISLLLMVSPSS